MTAHQLLDVVEAHVAAFNAGDWEQDAALHTADTVFEDKAGQLRYTGWTQVLGMFQAWKHAMPDVTVAITAGVANDTMVMIEVRMEGTQTGPLAGPTGEIPASGKRIRFEGVLAYRFAHGKIADTRYYYDLFTLLQQAGALPAAASVG